MKKHIPNILTTYRAIVAIFIPLLFFKSYYLTFIILFSTAILSDLIDGYLARKWNVTSQYGRFADALGDKLFALSSLVVILIFSNKYFFILLVGELFIMLTNLLIYIFTGNIKKKNFENRNSSIYGKIKTVFLFVTLLIGFLAYKIKFFNNIAWPFILVTAILQLVTAYFYFKDRNLTKKSTNK